MAEQTLRRYFSNFAYVRQDNPNTHYSVNTSTWYNLDGDGTDEKYLLGQFAAMSSSLKRYALVNGGSITFQAKTVSSIPTNNITLSKFDSPYNASTVTWNTMPSASALFGMGADKVTSDTGANYTIDNIAASIVATMFDVGRCVRFESNNAESDLYMKSVLTNGTTKMFMTIKYDDSIVVTSKVVTTATAASLRSNSSHTFSWEYQKNSAYYCADETWTQSSAIFYWKTSGAANYTSVNVSGSTCSVTIPAYTFPTGETIQWYVKGTDTDGTTTSSTVRSFTTEATTITPVTYPTGSTIDNRTTQTFSWNFVGNSSSTNYTQGSASLKWQVSGAGTWNTINASGTTRSISVPAYTFPANSTIDWYITGSDKGGSTSTSSTSSFTTLAYTLTITAAPSGSNIDTRAAQKFSWTLANTNGAATQTSYAFYWRVSGGAYTSISKTTSTKSISVAANTFPTASTIQWYVVVTAQDGTTYTSSTASFNTVSTKITLLTYPSGNDVDFASALPFSWYFKSNVGNYDQTSATLYWRAQTTDPWSTIAASGTTQSLSVPANTFPSGSTIYWYLEGTDSGGYTSSTSQTTFKTVTPQITPQDCPTSGYADPREAITFSWYFSTGGGSVGQTSASLFWREVGDVSYNEIQASGSQQSVTVAANTFPVASAVEWYLSGVDIGGSTSTTSVYTFSTTASTAYAVCQSPVGTAVDATKTVDLKWIVENEDGSAATRTVITWKLSTDANWTALLDTTNAITSYTVAANTFSAGAIQWKVIAYNRDSVAGPESTATFVALAAPDAPTGLTATAVPFTDISWQSSGQEAYEISIDGVVVQTGFGSNVYSWSVPEPLEDGAHTISVRIQGVYGFWSDPVTTQILVSNVPDGTLTLTGAFATDANIYWDYTGAGDPETIAIYRDDVWIGTATTTSTSYYDRFVLEEHTYRVEYWYASGYYTRSNDLTGTMSVSTVMIADLADVNWLELKLSEQSERTQGLGWSQTSAIMHVTASDYPIMEWSSYQDVSGSFECSFRERDSARAFEALRGKTVILKIRDGTVMVGGMSAMSKTIREFFTTYQFTIQRIHFEDFVNEQDN